MIIKYIRRQENENWYSDPTKNELLIETPYANPLNDKQFLAIANEGYVFEDGYQMEEVLDVDSLLLDWYNGDVTFENGVFTDNRVID